MSAVLGIDLGTTNSVVCVADGDSARVLPDEEGNALIPSVVSFHPSGDVLVGQRARERRLIDARNTVYSVKRLIGRPFVSPEVVRAQERFPFELCPGPRQGVLVRARGETYTLPEISAFVLREVRRIADSRLVEPATRAVITVPANFNELQRSATKAAGRVAGLEVLRILNEPTAAALAYGYGKGSRERIAIFDLGGGTFDITILELSGDVFEVLSTAGDTFLGGDDIDVLIAEKMADAFLAHHRFDPRTDAQAYERLRAAAEWAKCQLSSESEVQLRVEELAYGDGGVSLDLTFGLTRPTVEALSRPLIARAFDVCEDAMRIAGIRPTQLDNVILVGGSTRIPLVRSMVREYFGREPLTNIDPDLVVARGAALQAAALAPIAVGSGARRLARVALKKITRTEMLAARGTQESAPDLTLPKGPAFAPQRTPVPGWDPIAAETTRIADSLAEAERTAAGDAEDDSWDSSPTTAGASVAPSTPPRADRVRTAGQVSVGEAPRAPTPPPAPPAPPPTPSRRRPAPPPGARTIGFGSEGLPAIQDLPSYQAKQGASPSAPPPLPSAPPPSPPAPPQPPAPPRPPAPPASATPPTAPMPAVAAPFFPSDAPAPPAAPFFPGDSAPPVSPKSRPTPAERWVDGSSVAQPAPVAPPGPPAPIAPPLLLDVTPHTLGIETVGGFCESVIKRNAAIPVEQTRLFGTASDDQDFVSVRIYQGESRRLVENQALGQIELSNLRRALRGQVKIEVTFVMDADGTLGVRAVDKETGQAQQVRINLVGGVGDDEIQRMSARQAQLLGR